MADNSPIEWTDATWNPFRGCTRISSGCQNCYAERMAARNLPGHRSPTTGDPFAIMTTTGPRWTGKVELIEDQMDAPLHWRRPRRIFVNSMSDTFHERFQDEELEQIFAVMALCSHHTYILLTKRSGRMRRFMSDQHYLLAYMRRWLGGKVQHDGATDFPLVNVHLGVSAEDQQRFDERIEDLRATPAAVRWLSLEPLLGPIDLAGRLDGIHWVVVGGESGPGARPIHPDWVRSIRDACVEASVPFFFKQWGEHKWVGRGFGGSDDVEPSAVRIGKKRAGRMLDGREWNELPEVQHG